MCLQKDVYDNHELSEQVGVKEIRIKPVGDEGAKLVIDYNY